MIRGSANGDGDGIRRSHASTDELVKSVSPFVRYSRPIFESVEDNMEVKAEMGLRHRSSWAARRQRAMYDLSLTPDASHRANFRSACGTLSRIVFPSTYRLIGRHGQVPKGYFDLWI